MVEKGRRMRTFLRIIREKIQVLREKIQVLFTFQHKVFEVGGVVCVIIAASLVHPALGWFAAGLGCFNFALRS